MRKITIGMVILSIILIGMVIPAGFSGQANSVVITYGETTHANTNYKSDVDSFFKSQSNLDLSNAAEKGDMYLSALKSAGIKSGHVYVTSPVTATGESALAGIMNCYEEATNVKIPETVKEAANKEIYTQAEVVKDTNASSDQVSKLVDDVKETVKKENVTDHQTIVNIIYNYTVNNNINITNSSIENLANSIEQIQNTQGDINTYENQVSEVLNNTSSNSNNFLGGIFG